MGSAAATALRCARRGVPGDLSNVTIRGGEASRRAGRAAGLGHGSSKRWGLPHWRRQEGASHVHKRWPAGALMWAVRGTSGCRPCRADVALAGRCRACADASVALVAFRMLAVVGLGPEGRGLLCHRNGGSSTRAVGRRVALAGV